MKNWPCLLVLCAASVSCQREASRDDMSAPLQPPGTNVVSKVDDQGRPVETLVYATNGLLARHTFFQTAANGRVLSARTVDANGNPKWTETYSYDQTGGTRPTEVRRLKPDGTILTLRFSAAADGTEQRIVVAPDGKEIPAAEQKAYLGE